MKYSLSAKAAKFADAANEYLVKVTQGTMVTKNAILIASPGNVLCSGLTEGKYCKKPYCAMDASSRQALEDFVAATHVKHNAMIGPSNPRLGSKMSISDASLHQSSMDLDKTALAIAIREHDIP